MIQPIENLEPLQAQQLAPLFAAVWPEQRNHATDIRWAFQSSPLGSGLLLVARDSDNSSIITGARGSIPWPLCLADDTSAKVHQLHGTCVHPDYRRLGLFTQLNRTFLEQYEAMDGAAVFNISVAASRAGYEKLGWTYLPGLRRYLYFARPLAFAKTMLGNRGRLRSMLQSEHSRNDALPSWTVLQDLAEVREQALKGFHHTSPDETWLAWRYSRVDQGYRFVYRVDIGWCSYRMRRSGQIIEALLGDVWLLNARPSSVRALLSKVIEAEHPTIVSVLLTRGHPWHHAFVRAGFIPDWKGDLNFGVKLVGDAAHSMVDASRWALMTADIDTF